MNNACSCLAAEKGVQLKVLTGLNIHSSLSPVSGLITNVILSDPSLGLNERKRHLGVFIIAQMHAGACTYKTQRHGVIKNKLL